MLQITLFDSVYAFGGLWTVFIEHNLYEAYGLDPQCCTGFFFYSVSLAVAEAIHLVGKRQLLYERFQREP